MKREIYVFGSPHGFQIAGSEKHHEYISSFYNNVEKFPVSPLMIVAICGGNTFYTYIRSKDVIDANGRPNALFAMSVCFEKSYYKNVALIYDLFDKAYEHFCQNKILKLQRNGEEYTIQDLKNSPDVRKILEALRNNTGDRMENEIANLEGEINTYNAPIKQYNPEEVNSPIFFEQLRKYQIYVSPLIKLASAALEEANGRIQSLNREKNDLIQKNNILESSLRQESEENANLRNELHNQHQNSHKKYSKEIKELREQLDEAREKNRNLDQKYKEAQRIVEMVKEPLELAYAQIEGKRGPSKNKEHKLIEEEPETTKPNKKPKGRRFINLGLLSLIAALSIIILCVVCSIKRQSSSLIKGLQLTDSIENVEEDPKAAEPNPYEQDWSGENHGKWGVTPFEDEINWDDYKINIGGYSGSGALSRYVPYTLSIQKVNGGKVDDSLKNGEWVIFDMDLNKVVETLEGNIISLSDNALSGSRFKIGYSINGKIKKTRECTVQE